MHVSPNALGKDRLAASRNGQSQRPAQEGEPPQQLVSNLGLAAQGRPGYLTRPRRAPQIREPVSFLPTRATHIRRSPSGPARCQVGRKRAGAAVSLTFPKVTCGRWGRLQPGRASHLARGQGPSGCARGVGGVGGAGCRHFSSSPSLLSTCCCGGPGGSGASAAAAPGPPPAARRPPPRAPVRRCATSLLGPLLRVYMVRGTPRARPLARPAPSAGLALAGRRGRGPFNGQQGDGQGAGRDTPPALKGPARPGAETAPRARACGQAEEALGTTRVRRRSRAVGGALAEALRGPRSGLSRDGPALTGWGAVRTLGAEVSPCRRAEPAEGPGPG